MRFPIRKYRVYEESMTPEINPGNEVITEQLSYILRRPKVGEVVVVSHQGINQLKRIIKVEQNRYLLAGDNRELTTVFETKKPSILGRVFYVKGAS